MYLLPLTLRPGPLASPETSAAEAGELLTAAITRMPFVEHARAQARADRIDIGVFVTAKDPAHALARLVALHSAVDALGGDPPWWVPDPAGRP
ncbi:hypothetical protein GCM10009721_12050 [Terrabacter tumescens]|uniref:Uncharacterized protein n=1 Tax=Terrabacter tumescens TaxID=60443 RepID=A0ABQ2HRE8_9MICO|nr:hypothetical protein [Terrabacter tumescens]GGM88557.1 hypothetical protein GCM10009721_12050 [Terrabacter tumescens]